MWLFKIPYKSLLLSHKTSCLFSMWDHFCFSPCFNFLCTQSVTTVNTLLLSIWRLQPVPCTVFCVIWGLHCATMCWLLQQLFYCYTMWRRTDWGVEPSARWALSDGSLILLTTACWVAVYGAGIVLRSVSYCNAVRNTILITHLIDMILKWFNLVECQILYLQF